MAIDWKSVTAQADPLGFAKASTVVQGQRDASINTAIDSVKGIGNTVIGAEKRIIGEEVFGYAEDQKIKGARANDIAAQLRSLPNVKDVINGKPVFYDEKELEKVYTKAGLPKEQIANDRLATQALLEEYGAITQTLDHEDTVRANITNKYRQSGMFAPSEIKQLAKESTDYTLNKQPIDEIGLAARNNAIDINTDEQIAMNEQKLKDRRAMFQETDGPQLAENKEFGNMNGGEVWDRVMKGEFERNDANEFRDISENYWNTVTAKGGNFYSLRGAKGGILKRALSSIETNTPFFQFGKDGREVKYANKADYVEAIQSAMDRELDAELLRQKGVEDLRAAESQLIYGNAATRRLANDQKYKNTQFTANKSADVRNWVGSKRTQIQ